MSIPQALESLRPGAEWTLIGDTLTWSDTSQTEPTKAEIDAEIIRLEYARNRREEYPDLAEQLDYIYPVSYTHLRAHETREDRHCRQLG